MRKALLTVLFISLAAGGCLGLEVQGIVLTQEGRPVVGAVVFYRSSLTKSVTDEEGVFKLSLPDGKDMMYVYLSNLFIKTNLARPAPDSIEESGRHVIIGLNLMF